MGDPSPCRSPGCRVPCQEVVRETRSARRGNKQGERIRRCRGPEQPSLQHPRPWGELGTPSAQGLNAGVSVQDDGHAFECSGDDAKGCGRPVRVAPRLQLRGSPFREADAHDVPEPS